MIEINAYKDGKGNIVISEDSFEMLLGCLDNQKFVGELPQNGDSAAEGESEYYKTQKDIQDVIDSYNRMFRNILHSKLTVVADANGTTLFKRYENQIINLEWSNAEVERIQDLLSDKTPDKVMRADNFRVLMYHQPKHCIRPWTKEEVDIISDDLKNNE